MKLFGLKSKKINVKICFMFPYFRPHFGGVERVLEEVSSRMGEHEVHILTSKIPGTCGYELFGGVHVHRINCFLPKNIPYPIPRLLGLRILSTLKKIDPDVIITHNVVSYFTLTAMLAKPILKKPLVLVLHTTDANYGSLTHNIMLKAYYVTIGFFRNSFNIVCAPMENDLFRMQPDIIIPNGVDKEKFKKADKKSARIHLQLPEKKKIVLFVGRFNSVKGIENLIKIINSLEEYLFVLVGEGSKEEEIKRKTMHENILIRQPTDEIEHYYQAADACIIPSLAEGFCLTAIEAKACETPIVGSNVGIIPNLTRYTHPPKNWEEMSSSLKKSCEHENTGKTEYEIKDWSEIAKKYNELLKEVIKKNKK